MSGPRFAHLLPFAEVEEPRGWCPEYPPGIEPDDTRCALAADCVASTTVSVRDGIRTFGPAAIGVVLDMDPETGGDRAHWATPFRAAGDGDPVYVCEDCAAWIEEGEDG